MAEAPATLAVPAAAGAPGGWARLRRDRVAMGGLWVLIVVALVCFLVPPFMDAARNAPSSATFQPPGTQVADAEGNVRTYLLGTDANGRDLLFRILSGGRVSLIVGLCAAAVSLFIGTVIGLTAGYLGGKVDAVLMRGVDVLYAMPRLLFVLILISALQEPLFLLLEHWRHQFQLWDWPSFVAMAEGIRPYSRTLILIACLGAIEWLTMARIVRGQVLVLREQQFVAAARCLGQSHWKIMTRHLLPNLWTVILTYLTLTVPVVVLDESFLSYLGLGIDEPAASWGALLKEGASALNPLEFRWWMLVCPAVAMSITLLALNFLGDGLRDALDVH